ncbi:sugar phosphate isomerase/epimerase [Clostridium sp. chh4-2]|uniref:sugar phosphate isomerase/epimerase family protein n=1 Tax=Clostridium sp. chh4-2 TaxID=2067550 RepID=UPI000CCED8EF|nr:sugar phosphate isomerase/epimerase family protein [Clostridium sp. chh4-2]PNV60611.1 sugar phosphate isomerase/epimerase [Clostridium sp. chh4-2]
MRFGCCGNLVASGPDKTGIEIVERIAQYGYDYIELPLAEMMDLSDGEFEALRKRVDASGIKCEVCNNFFPAKIRLTGPEVNMELIKAYIKDSLSRAKELGVGTVVFGSGTAKNVPEGFSHETAYRQVAEISKEIVPVAKANGITIVIEPIRKPECNIINTFEEGVALAKEVDDETMMVLIDYYHMTWEKESPKILRKYGKEYLRHVHFAYPNIPSEIGRLYPSDMEEWDYKEFIGILKEIGYDGRVSIEAGVTDFDTQAKQAIQFLRSNF